MYDVWHWKRLLVGAGLTNFMRYFVCEWLSEDVLAGYSPFIAPRLFLYHYSSLTRHTQLYGWNLKLIYLHVFVRGRFMRSQHIFSCIFFGVNWRRVYWRIFFYYWWLIYSWILQKVITWYSWQELIEWSWMIFSPFVRILWIIRSNYMGLWE